MTPRISRHSKTEVSIKQLFVFTKLFVVVYLFPGVDDLLAQHIAHLFIRDPVCLFREKVHQSVEEDMDHFEVRWQLLLPLL